FPCYRRGITQHSARHLAPLSGDPASRQTFGCARYYGIHRALVKRLARVLRVPPRPFERPRLAPVRAPLRAAGRAALRPLPADFRVLPEAFFARPLAARERPVFALGARARCARRGARGRRAEEPAPGASSPSIASVTESMTAMPSTVFNCPV